MINEPDQSRLDKIPQLYQTEDIPTQDKLVYLHFFIGESQWWILEYDGDDTFFGYAVLNGDYQMAEFGYISFSELKSICIGGILEVYCDPEEIFPVQKLSDIPCVAANARAFG